MNSEQGMDGESYLSEEVWLTPLLGTSHHFKSRDWLILQVWWKWTFGDEQWMYPQINKHNYTV